MTTQELIEAVRAHANANYESGWDVIVECWEDADIKEAIGRARTIEGALRKIRPGVRARASVYAEHQAEAALGRGDDADYDDYEY